MLIITSIPISEEDAEKYGLDCDSVDYANILAAEQKNESTFQGCSQVVSQSVAFKLADDMVVPVSLCALHFAALSLSLHEGVGVDEDSFGKFPNH